MTVMNSVIQAPNIDLETGLRNPNCRYIVRLEQDGDCANPMTDWDGSWTLKTFPSWLACDSVITDMTASEAERGYEPRVNIGIRRKLKVGLAFWIRSSGDVYHPVKDPNNAEGVDDYRGILLWEHAPSDMGAKSYDDRFRDAELCLDVYNAWVTGDCYGFDIETADGRMVDACWGFLGPDVQYMFDRIAAAIKSDRGMDTIDMNRITFEGDSKELAKRYHL